MARRLLVAVACLAAALTLACECREERPAAALPRMLSTSSRWIVDEHGRRVKLACVNWASHLEPMLAEGLEHQTLGAIASSIAAMGFNCVRLTWPTFLTTCSAASLPHRC
jgi:hypothetical protein